MTSSSPSSERNSDNIRQDDLDENNDSEFKFVRRAGTSGLGGQIYEIYMCMLMLLRKENEYVGEFYLASNVQMFGDFDDVTVKIGYNDGLKKNRIIFIQAKHRQSPDKASKINFDMLLSSESGDFSLQKYFRSYRTIRGNFDKMHSNDPILKSKFDDCEFIIFTNALPDKKFVACNESVQKLEVIDNLLSFGKICCYHQLCFGNNHDINERIKEVLRDTSNCRRLVKELVIFIKCGEISKLISKYKTALFHKVFSFRDCKFKECFINGESLSADEIIFRAEFFAELKKIYPYETDLAGFLKNKKIPCSNLKVKDEYNFSLPTDLVGDEEIQDFITKFKLFIAQPDKNEIEQIIKKEMEVKFKVPQNNVDDVFSSFMHKVRLWWEESDRYLTKNDTSFKESARIFIWYHVKPPVEPFTGRKSKLAQLHSNLQKNPSKPTVISQMTSICGLGGVGKTELAKKYAQEYCDYYDNNIIWINAENEETLTDSFITLAKDKLGITTKDYDGSNKKITSVVGEIYNYFSRCKCLFIFDNAERNDFLIDFLPLEGLNPDASKPFLLFTSRNQEWENGIEVICLEEFEKEEAEEFLMKVLDTEDQKDSQAITNLATKLQRFPLALQQASAYINSEKAIDNGKYAIRDYLAEYNNQTKKVLDYKGFRGINNRYAQTTFTTWKITIDKMLLDVELGPLALEIFHMIAYCAPENIPIKLFLILTDYDDRQLKRVIHYISKYSLIKIEENKFGVHRLVQEVTRLNLRSDEHEVSVLKKLLYIIGNNPTHVSIEHATVASKYAMQFEKLTINYMGLWFKVVQILNDKYQHQHALSLAIKLNSHIENNLNDDNTFISHHLIVDTLVQLGKYQDAIERCKNILHRFPPHIGNDHLFILRIRSILANLLTNVGKYGEASELLKSNIEKYTKIYSDDNLFTLTEKKGLAVIFAAQMKNDEALSIYNEILKKVIKSHGRENELTLELRENIAVLLDKTGKHDKALFSLYDILETSTRVLGKDHPITIKIKQDIALLKMRQNTQYDAIETLYDCLEKFTKVLGREHPVTLATQHRIAIVMSDQKKYVEAMNISQQTYKMYVGTIGETHPHTLLIQENIAHLFAKNGKLDEAAEMYHDIFQKQVKLLGTDNPMTIATQFEAGKILNAQKKYHQAMLTQQEVVKKQIRILGEEHPDTLCTQYVIARLYMKLGDIDRAVNVFCILFEKYAKVFGKKHRLTLKVQMMKVALLWTLSKYEDARKSYEEMFKEYISLMNFSDQRCVTSNFEETTKLWSLGKYNEAWLMWIQIQKQCNSILGW